MLALMTVPGCQPVNGERQSNGRPTTLHVNPRMIRREPVDSDFTLYGPAGIDILPTDRRG